MPVRVSPSGRKWRVEKHGRTVSSHRKKRRAVEKARRVAASGSQLVIHRADGTIQETSEVR